MSDLIPSLIRTYTPIIVGQLVAWLTLKGVQLDDATVVGLTAALGGTVSAVYYLVVRLLEKKFPAIGVLLGSTRKPEYAAPVK